MREWLRRSAGSWAAGLLGVAFGVVLGVGGLTLANRQRPAPIVIVPPATPLPTATAGPTATSLPLRVHVSGAVAAPGVYALPPGGVVEAAITAAGGMTAEADTAVVNLAQPLRDGMQIIVPREGERLPPAVAAGVSESETAVGGPVNINTAEAALLETLPGIGPSTAGQIVAYRDENGPFDAIEQILDVPGIGPAKFAQIRDLIAVGP